MRDSVDPRLGNTRDLMTLESNDSNKVDLPFERVDFQIARLIDQGEEPRRIFQVITDTALSVTGCRGVALFLPSEKATNSIDMFASSGDFKAEGGKENDPSNSQRITTTSPTSQRWLQSNSHHYFDIICLGTPVGTLALEGDINLNEDTLDRILILAHQASIVYERFRLNTSLQHFQDRLQVLNELNQLIASNVNLPRIVKTLARESAFRFSADVAITYIFDDEFKYLEGKGSYGCPAAMIPKISEQDSGVLGQALRTGGHISIQNIQHQRGHGLPFLEGLGIKGISVCCLEVRGESLGAVLIGFKREMSLSEKDRARFEEFSQAAAVAISNSRTQERITAYTERLEELVSSRTADLVIQTQKAEDANHAKSQFLANMSHELRTPLTAIVGYSSVLADGIFGPLNDKQIDALNAVTRSSEHLKNLIDDVLNLSRIESGKEAPEPKSVALKELLNQVFKLILQTAVQKGVALQPLEIPEEVMNSALWVDTKHIHQIAINLMSNAVKYTPRGGKVWLEASVVSDKVRIAVRDTGVGIPPHKIDKLFERFERGEDTYSKSQEGTGIGLNLTKRLVELNGGSIGAESTEGEGSTFWILVPIAAQNTTTVVQVDNTKVSQRLDGLSAVVVDDNKDTCEVLKTILMASGATVSTANSVREGLEVVESTKPDIILTDMAMPGESGIALIESIRNREDSLSTLPIIVLSACAFAQDQKAAIDAGASMFLPKPFKPTDVISNVRKLTILSALGG